jgi:hypothetical protein
MTDKYNRLNGLPGAAVQRMVRHRGLSISHRGVLHVYDLVALEQAMGDKTRQKAG